MRVSCAHVYVTELAGHRGAPQSHRSESSVSRAHGSRVSFPAEEPACSAGARVARVMRARFHAFWPWIRV